MLMPYILSSHSFHVAGSMTVDSLPTSLGVEKEHTHPNQQPRVEHSGENSDVLPPLFLTQGWRKAANGPSVG
jgi:hypothetical protein